MIEPDLEKPLDPELEYFDATPSIEELGKAFATLHARLEMLEQIAKVQLGINTQVNDTMKQLLLDRAEKGTEQKSGLVLPERFKH